MINKKNIREIIKDEQKGVIEKYIVYFVCVDGLEDVIQIMKHSNSYFRYKFIPNWTQEQS